MANDLQKRQDFGVMTPELAELAGRGFEHTTAKDVVIPFLSLLQDLSPQVKGTTKIPGAEIGMFFNTATEEVYGPDRTLVFIPVHWEHCFMEWRPRKKGGGLVRRLSVDDPVALKAQQNAEEFGKYVTPAGNDLVETYYVYGVLSVDGGDQVMPCVIAFTSTKIKVWKKYFTRLSYALMTTPDGQRRQPPLFAHRINVTSVDDRNKSGQEFKNVALTPANGTIKESMVTDVNDELFQTAIGLAQMIASGQAKADFSAQSSAAVDDEGDADGVF